MAAGYSVKFSVSCPRYVDAMRRRSANQVELFGALSSARCCVRCGVQKPPEEFAWRNKQKGKLFAHCRACQAKYHHEHYQKNRQKYIDRAAARTGRVVAENGYRLLAFLSSKACADCGETDPIVLEFDHRADKEFEISQALRYRSWNSILIEIAKCDVVCVNCHRRRTSARNGSLRASIAEQRKSSS
jgi:hypothetical protein